MERRSFFERYRPTNLATDPLPLKVLNHTIWEAEMLGHALDWASQYLHQKSCPSYLISPLLGKIMEEISTANLSDCYSQGISCKRNLDDVDSDVVVVRNVSYQPLKLMQSVTTKVDDICLRYKEENDKIEQDFPEEASEDPNVAQIFGVSHWSIKNTRRTLEDRMVILPLINKVFNLKTSTNYFAVFDGHNGVEAAAYSAAHLHRHLVASPDFSSDLPSALNFAFEATDTALLMKCKDESLRSGTTAVVALVVPGNIYIAWVGDSQAVLLRNTEPVSLVSPHKPDREDELRRIKSVGGEVISVGGTWRVNGNLAVSRAIGNLDYKEYVTSTPEISHIETDGSEEFLILACDGLWDVISPQRCTEIIRNSLLSENPSDIDSVSQKLVAEAKQSGSGDNITVIVVLLKAKENLIKLYSEEKPKKMNGSVEASVPPVPASKLITPKTSAASTVGVGKVGNSTSPTKGALPSRTGASANKSALGQRSPAAAKAPVKVAEKRPPAKVPLTKSGVSVTKTVTQKEPTATKPAAPRTTAGTTVRATLAAKTAATTARKPTTKTNETEKPTTAKSTVPPKPRLGAVPPSSRLTTATRPATRLDANKADETAGTKDSSVTKRSALTSARTTAPVASTTSRVAQARQAAGATAAKPRVPGTTSTSRPLSAAQPAKPAAAAPKKPVSATAAPASRSPVKKPAPIKKDTSKPIGPAANSKADKKAVSIKPKAQELLSSASKLTIAPKPSDAVVNGTTDSTKLNGLENVDDNCNGLEERPTDLEPAVKQELVEPAASEQLQQNVVELILDENESSQGIIHSGEDKVAECKSEDFLPSSVPAGTSSSADADNETSTPLSAATSTSDTLPSEALNLFEAQTVSDEVEEEIVNKQTLNFMLPPITSDEIVNDVITEEVPSAEISPAHPLHENVLDTRDEVIGDVINEAAGLQTDLESEKAESEDVDTFDKIATDQFGQELIAGGEEIPAVTSSVILNESCSLFKENDFKQEIKEEIVAEVSNPVHLNFAEIPSDSNAIEAFNMMESGLHVFNGEFTGYVENFEISKQEDGAENLLEGDTKGRTKIEETETLVDEEEEFVGSKSPILVPEVLSSNENLIEQPNIVPSEIESDTGEQMVVNHNEVVTLPSSADDLLPKDSIFDLQLDNEQEKGSQEDLLTKEIFDTLSEDIDTNFQAETRKEASGKETEDDSNVDLKAASEFPPEATDVEEIEVKTFTETLDEHRQEQEGNAGDTVLNNLSTAAEECEEPEPHIGSGASEPVPPSDIAARTEELESNVDDDIDELQYEENHSDQLEQNQEAIIQESFSKAEDANESCGSVEYSNEYSQNFLDDSQRQPLLDSSTAESNPETEFVFQREVENIPPPGLQENVLELETNEGKDFDQEECSQGTKEDSNEPFTFGKVESSNCSPNFYNFEGDSTKIDCAPGLNFTTPFTETRVESEDAVVFNQQSDSSTFKLDVNAPEFTPSGFNIQAPPFVPSQTFPDKDEQHQPLDDGNLAELDFGFTNVKQTEQIKISEPFITNNGTHHNDDMDVTSEVGLKSTNPFFIDTTPLSTANVVSKSSDFKNDFDLPNIGSNLTTAGSENSESDSTSPVPSEPVLTNAAINNDPGTFVGTAANEDKDAFAIFNR